jgi:hypothetical protein
LLLAGTSQVPECAWPANRRRIPEASVPPASAIVCYSAITSSPSMTCSSLLMQSWFMLVLRS